MHISFVLDWLPPGALRKKIFKSAALQVVFCDYLKRLSHFTPATFSGRINAVEPKSNAKRWICERKKGVSKNPSSEEIAEKVGQILLSGCQQFQIIIGGPDGFSDQTIQQLKPDFIWSFGALTYPHELAAVVSAEQIYRAWTILKKMPYHVGH
ncbi:MAG: hypothetical protein COV74_03370 [Candidatus Omnitrophica bacterium CG11_big_fil_rev_8_21_14_0_20_45_26]|uniref:Uncharacterized protein n=1 Tax=Candidatus Abzuiibacterium crystallinum TaxID=1974748 RepID=A0A2H0LR14_9BACT|nr:MAG: hypothetical protein COV74_03370 [Candidatus Omnitrophica bacterium CG11_big_fil_rev_8_21_14_0_20_45_26]PIW64242.1 MAG: hypothetical protein COW12_07000 [Candidatus Omnitrophica bacterium CG12_big_fil_rev_8_21_14_0_65_45_16]